MDAADKIVIGVTDVNVRRETGKIRIERWHNGKLIEILESPKLSKDQWEEWIQARLFG